MKIEMERKLNAEMVECIANLKIIQRRPDIQKVLMHGTFSSLPLRLKDYLMHLDLIDNDYTITNGGSLAEETGEVAEKEYGQYEIWLIKDDIWLETRPIALRRIYPGKPSNEHDKWNKGSNIKFSDDIIGNIFDFNKNAYTELSLIDVKSIRILNPKKESVRVVFTASSDSPVFEGSIEGTLPWSGKNNSPSPIEVSYTLSQKINEILPLLLNEYNSEKGALEVFVPDDESEIVSMVRNEIILNQEKCMSIAEYGNFDQVIISKIPLIPNGKKTAEEWIRRLMLYYWKNNYISVRQSETDQKAWIQKDGFNNYALSIDSGTSLLKRIGKDHGDIYWNIAAMQDLIPPGSKIRVPFQLQKNENVLPVLQENLFDGKTIGITIADKFIKDSGVLFLKKLLPQDIDVILYTKEKISEELPNKWILKTLPDKNKDIHDRIWVIKSENSMSFWSSTNSLDHFKCIESGAEIDTFMTFAPVQELPPYLEKIIKGDDK